MEKNREYYVGLEWTNEVDQEGLIENFDKLSCIEFIPENFFDNRRRDFLDKLNQSKLPVLVHSVELSLGTMEPLKEEHWARVVEVAERVNTVNFSDHLSMTEAGNVEIGQLTPVPWTIECADHICRTIDAFQKRVSVPFLIENITNRFLIPEQELTETEFINRILERTGCGLLIDMNNVHTNATNFKFDPKEWIDSINLTQVQGVHLAGGFYDEDGDLVDSHSNWVQPETWDLFRHLCSRIIPPYTIVEWTAGGPKLEDVLSEVATAEGILAQAVERLRPRLAERATAGFAAVGGV